jgi:UDP-N-acetylglucosamine acyltransferase
VIDKLAIIDPSAKIAPDVIIGPYTIISAEVEIGAGTWIGPHAIIKGATKIGKNNKIYQFTSIGEDPQDIKYQGEKTYLEIGDNNIIREFCTIDRGTPEGEKTTRIGDHNMLMSYVHIAHDCQIGNHTVFANNATLAGHVQVDDYAVLGGFAVIHQFCQLGTHCFISGGSLVTKDILPFVKVAGNDIYARPFGLNAVGLRRRGFTPQTRKLLKQAYKIIHRQNLTTTEAITKLQLMTQECPEIQAFIEIMQTSKHGIAR